MRIRADGHVQSLELDGIETDIAQAREALEHMRQLSRKLMAPLSIAMPKGQHEQALEAPRHADVFELITTSGTTGGVALKYRVDGEASGVACLWWGRARQPGVTEPDGRATNAGAMNMGASQTSLIPKRGPFTAKSRSWGVCASNVNLATGTRYALAAWIGRTAPTAR